MSVHKQMSPSCPTQRYGEVGHKANGVAALYVSKPNCETESETDMRRLFCADVHHGHVL